jgi:rhamnulokinase
VTTTVVAVDFGAASIRVCRVELPGPGEPPAQLEVVHRIAHQPVPDDAGHLRWDWHRLVHEMTEGLERAVALGPVASIGVDTWGVDYGLLDDEGQLVAPPFSYRDHRTDGYHTVVDRIGETELYETTGIQLQPFNTIFQLAAHDRSELERARHLLLLPELLVHDLTGEVWAERTSAGTTGLVDLATGSWSTALLDAVDVDAHVFAPIFPAATLAGRWRGIPVHLVGGHDTASAVAGMGATVGTDAAFVSAGTWMLVGREQPAPCTEDWARKANFTNEVGVLGGTRFLKNLAGSWLIEGCRTAWGNPPLTSVLAAAEAIDNDGPIVDVTDARFLHPDDMLAEVTAAAGLPRDADPAVVVRCIVESLVAGTAGVLDQLGGVSEVHVFGGGGQSGLFRRRLAEQTGVPVLAGPVEATALGNALVQGIGLGLYTDLTDARRRLPPSAARGNGLGLRPSRGVS